MLIDRISNGFTVQMLLCVFAQEDSPQAIDRVHRIGQTKKVKVTRLTIKVCYYLFVKFQCSPNGESSLFTVEIRLFLLKRTLRSKGTIEEHILQIQEEKRGNVTDAYSGGSVGTERSNKLSFGDLAALFGLGSAK